MENTVFWAELQSELSAAGLKVVLGIPRPESPWFGKIDDKTFAMTIAPKNNEDGLRDLMIISLYGQDEEKVIPLLSKFMGYKPFCRYLHKENSTASATYEWDKKDPNARLKNREKNVNVHELQKLEKGFEAPKTPGMEKFYHQITPEDLNNWEEAAQKNPDVEWSYSRVKDLLPFVKKVMPRIGQNQSLFGFSIICLNGKFKGEKEVVEYGLEPLLVANIITEEEATRITNWYLQTQPTWDSGEAGRFQKEFEIENIKYRLITDSCRNCRDLNLQILSK